MAGYEAVREARQQAKAEFADLRASMVQRAIAAANARHACSAASKSEESS